MNIVEHFRNNFETYRIVGVVAACNAVAIFMHTRDITHAPPNSKEAELFHLSNALIAIATIALNGELYQQFFGRAAQDDVPVARPRIEFNVEVVRRNVLDPLLDPLIGFLVDRII